MMKVRIGGAALVAVLVVPLAVGTTSATPTDTAEPVNTVEHTDDVWLTVEATADDSEVGMVVVGNDDIMVVVWASEGAELTTAEGESITARWTGELSSSELADAWALVESYLGNSNGGAGLAQSSGGWICRSRQLRPFIRATVDVTGRMSQKCTGKNADEHRVSLRLKRWEEYGEYWNTRLSGTSDWEPARNQYMYFPISKDCNLTTQTDWRTEGEGTLRLTNGEYRYLPTMASGTATGRCVA